MEQVRDTKDLEGKNIVVFDLEIQKAIVTEDREIDPEWEVAGWGEANSTLISVAYLYDYSVGKYLAYDQWTLLPLAQRLSEADVVVGHNHIKFDYGVLNGHIDIIFGEDSGKYKVKSSPVRDFDIMMQLKKANGGQWNGKGNFSLDSVGEKTCGINKSGHGSDAPMLWREGRYAELYNYCRDDVAVTREVYEHIYTMGFAIDGSGKRFNINAQLV